MPGGNEPKAKKRKRGDRREKEKPLLAVQGLLRLEHSFTKPNNDDAEVLEVQVGDEKKKIVLAPAEGAGGEKSEHDMVGYKSGYETGPVNPLPQDEREEKLFAERKVYEDANDYFEEMKAETEEKREEREAAWAEEKMSEAEKRERSEKKKAKKAAKKAAEEAAKLKEQELDLSAYGYAADDNPDNPDNYQTPEFANEVNVFGSFKPKSTDMREVGEASLQPPGEDEKEEEQPVTVVHSEGDTRVVVHHAGDADGDDGGLTGPKEMTKLTGAANGREDEAMEDSEMSQT